MNPLISCLMPTADRREFVPAAIRHFLEQDYPERELVILDDGKDPIADLVPPDPRLRYLRLERKEVIGAKRNRAARAARGRILVHWDDDDWMAPWRLSYQFRRLQETRADVCGLARVWFISHKSPEAWQYVYPRNQRRWLCGGTLMYRREFWERNPFPAIAEGEDTRFVWAKPTARLEVLDHPDFYVARIHSRNTSAKRTRGTCWRPVNRQQVDTIMKQASANVRLVQSERTASGFVPTSHFRVPTSAFDDTESERITVSIPFFRARPYIRRAVESILSQTHHNLRLVVINDADAEGPWRELTDLDDPRLIRFDLPLNRGRYFADAVVLAATPDPWFATQDADDWSEPDRLACLLALACREQADCAVSSVVHESAEVASASRRQVDSVNLALRRPMDRAFRHRLGHHALFRSETVRELGGYYAGFRVGYDTLLMNLLLMAGKVVGEERVLYHRVLRRGSLIHDRATGWGSRLRTTTSRHLARLYVQAYSARHPSSGAEAVLPVVRQRLKDLVARNVPAEERRALVEQSERLRALLEASGTGDGRTTTRPPRLALPAPTADGPSLSAKTIRKRSADPWGTWSISDDVAQALTEHCHTRRPRRVLELGSGRSTLVLAEGARELGFELVTLEHDLKFYRQTRARLIRAGLGRFCQLHFVPLRKHSLPGRTDARWYSAQLEGRFDFVFADGPPERFGRSAILFALQRHLTSAWELWLNDAERLHERDCVRLWQQHIGCSATSLSCGHQKVWRLGPNRAGKAEASTQRDGIILTLLTGQRPELLRRTLTALQAALGERLAGIPGIVLVNGGDEPTHRVLDTAPTHWRRLESRGEVLPVGPAWSRLMREALSLSECGLVFHLEDDWVAAVRGTDWLSRAAEVLASDPSVGQVRLRSAAEKTLPYHMITRRPIRWVTRGDLAVASSAHFTFNPSLVRAAEMARIGPAADERDAQKHYLAQGLWTAQLLPGVFRHIGQGQSLSERLGRR